MLSLRIVGGMRNKWIMILREFDLRFMSAKSKKSLTFVELMPKLSWYGEDMVESESLPDEHIFVNSEDLWYQNILVYLQT